MAKARSHDSSNDAARAEALRLLTEIRQDLDELAAFISAEEVSVDRKALGPKRVARLRLIAQDVASASAFARRSDKT